MKFFLTLILVGAMLHASGQSSLMKSGEPRWVETDVYDPNSLDTTGASNGYHYLLISHQHHLESGEFYRRYAIKVLSEEGLASASSIEIGFDPSYRKLMLHSLVIIRGDRRIDKLDLNKFELIRREEEMDRAVYNKTLTAVYNMPDVRVGDVVEYSYTLRGSNPVFNGHHFGYFYLQYAVPVQVLSSRVFMGSGRNIKTKVFGLEEEPHETNTAGIRKIEWVLRNVSPVLVDDMLPSWYDPLPYVQYTDFESWDEVRTWAASVFHQDVKSNPDLKDLIHQVESSGGTIEEKVRECIRMVQGDIRYLSFSDGINGYKPHAPDWVYQQKYGDCKDKSVLLSYLLNGIGVRSNPALVSTDYGEILDDVLPAPTAFNHCIVQFTIADSTYWVDPTLNTQVGPLKSFWVPSYKRALVVDDQHHGLSVMAMKEDVSSISVMEEYTMDEVGGEVKLKVQSRYYGTEAETMRSYFNRNSMREIQKNYLNFYARDYSEIEFAKPVAFEDDKAANLFTSTEEYVVKNFWTIEEETGHTASLYARVMSSYLAKPETRIRTMPLHVEHPKNILHTIKVYLPEEWTVDNYHEEVESDAFTYRSAKFHHDKVLTLRHEYRTKAPFVKAEASAVHVRNVEKALDDLGFMIYRELPGTSQPGSSPVAFLLLVAVIVAGVIFIVRKQSR